MAKIVSNRIDELRRKVRPRRIFDEMAELGLLEEYLARRRPGDPGEGNRFRDELLEIMLERSSVPIAEIELINLESLSVALNKFMETAGKWKNRKL